MIWLDFKAYESLYNQLIIYNGKLINLSFWLFVFRFPVKLPIIFLCNCFLIRKGNYRNISQKTVACNNIFNWVSQFIYLEIEAFIASVFHYANLQKNYFRTKIKK